MLPLTDAQVWVDGHHLDNDSVPKVDEMFSSNMWGIISSMTLTVINQKIRCYGL